MQTHHTTHTHTHTHDESHSVLKPALWGVLFGAIQSAAPLAIRWLDPVAVQAVCLAFICAVYIGFAVADGRTKVLVAEAFVAASFLTAAFVGVTASAWVLVAAYAAHGAKDLWQHRTRFVANTRWWPPYCATIDFIVAAVIAVEIAAGYSLR